MLVTQSRLAKFLGVTFQQIQKYEKGGNGCSLPKLLMIATFFQKPITYFFRRYKFRRIIRARHFSNNNPIAPS